MESQAAKAARDQARVSARQGQYTNRNSITVAAYLDQWLEARAVEVKPKTLQDYRHLINRHVRPYIGELRLQAMSPARLTKLYRELATNGRRDGAGLSPRTVEYVHAVLRKAFRDAVVVDQILLSNPVERAKRPRKARSYVFSTAWGEPIHPDTVSSLMTTLTNIHNDQQSEPLPHARLHDLRHVHATTLLLAGVPVHVVAARLGHADPSITLRVYAHVISDQLTEAADIFARAVAGAS